MEEHYDIYFTLVTILESFLEIVVYYFASFVMAIPG